MWFDVNEYGEYESVAEKDGMLLLLLRPTLILLRSPTATWWPIGGIAGSTIVGRTSMFEVIVV